MRLPVIAGVIAALALLIAIPTALGKPAPPAPGNSLNAKACQKGGWEGLQGSDGTQFADEKACTSYAAKGGTLVPKPTFAGQAPCEAAGGTFQPGVFARLWSCGPLDWDFGVDTILLAACIADGGGTWGYVNAPRLYTCG